MANKATRPAAGADPEGFRASIDNMPLRIYQGEIKSQEIIAYDFDNSYPDRMKILSDSSVMAKTCKDLYGKYVFGKGFADDVFAGTLLNERQTANRVLKMVVNDIKDYGGMALWIGYNGLLEITSIKHLSFNFVRLVSDESKHPGTYAIHPDWACLYSKKFDEKKIDYVDKFNPNRGEIMAQIKRAGGFDKWKGQVLWMPLSLEEEYPLTPYDHALYSIQTDVEIDLFKNRNVMTSFLAYYIMYIYQGFQSTQEEAEFDETIERFQGGRRAAKIMKIKNVNKENKPDIEKVDINNNDKLFEYHESSSQKKIRVAFRVPRELVGEDSNSGFDTERVKQSSIHYNSITEDDRLIIKEVFEMFMPYTTQAIRGSGNYSIRPKIDEVQAVVKKKK